MCWKERATYTANKICMIFIIFLGWRSYHSFLSLSKSHKVSRNTSFSILRFCFSWTFYRAIIQRYVRYNYKLRRYDGISNYIVYDRVCRMCRICLCTFLYLFKLNCSVTLFGLLQLVDCPGNLTLLMVDRILGVIHCLFVG